MAQSAGFKLALKALVSLSKSDQPITAKKIDAIIDPYLISNGKLTDEDRKQLAAAFLEGRPEEYEARWRKDFGGELRRASQMRRRFYGNFWGAPFTERMIEFARGHRGIKKVLGDLVAGEQGYVDLKKKLARKALRPI